MNVILASRLTLIASSLQSSVDCFGAIANYIAIIAGDKKNLFVTKVFNKNAVDGMRLPRIDTLPSMTSLRWMKDKAGFLSQALFWETWLIDVQSICGRKKVQVVPLRECGQVATP